MAGEVGIETVVRLINFGAVRQLCVSKLPHRQSANRNVLEPVLTREYFFHPRK